MHVLPTNYLNILCHKYVLFFGKQVYQSSKKKTNTVHAHIRIISLITACVFHINVIVFKPRIFDILECFSWVYKKVFYITIPEPILGMTFGDSIVHKFHFISFEKFYENLQQQDLTF